MGLPMSGMGHMLKALGINPEEITASVTSFMDTVQKAIAEVRANQEAITAQNSATQFLLKEVVAGQVEILSILKRKVLEDSDPERLTPTGLSVFDPRDVEAAVSVFDVNPGTLDAVTNELNIQHTIAKALENSPEKDITQWPMKSPSA